MRLIDADKFRIEILVSANRENYGSGFDDYDDGCISASENLLGILDAFPTVDAAPVVHAHWDYSTCSHCGHDLTEIMDADSYLCIGFDPDNYVACPFCGAKMDEENKA